MKTRNIRRPLAKAAALTAAGVALTSAAAGASSNPDSVINYEPEAGTLATVFDDGRTTSFKMDDSHSVAFKKDGGFTQAVFSMGRQVVGFTLDDGDSVAFKKPSGVTAFTVEQTDHSTFLRD